MPAVKKPSTINVLFMAAEAAPLVKVGGLGDVAGSLPVTLRKLGAPNWKGAKLDVRLILPFHDEINRQIREPRFVASFMVDHPGESLPAKAFITEVNGLPVYLIEGPPILPDMSVYSSNPLQDGEKYIFFSLAVLELIHTMDWRPHIVHANDWHTAAAIYGLALRKPDPLIAKKIRTLLTIHNLPFMGKDAEEALIKYGLPRSRDKRLPKWATLFPLPLGLLSADQIVAVSPGYAEEILTPEFGCGLQEFLTTRSESITGILNGLDQDAWDPATDSAITARYTIDSLDPRVVNKTNFQEEVGLTVNPEIPLLVMINRLDQQKGIDIAIDGLRLSAGLEWQVVILGTGDPLLESACRSLEAEYPDRVRAIIRFDGRIARQMYASGDILLMPSRYEPCGLAQMIAMRYGCLPLARATGGLKNTIRDDPNYASSTGFLFHEPTPEAFTTSLERALYLFADHTIWQEIQYRAMRQDFSWEKSALEYAHIYTRMLEKNQ